MVAQRPKNKMSTDGFVMCQRFEDVPNNDNSSVRHHKFMESMFHGRKRPLAEWKLKKDDVEAIVDPILVNNAF